ncbi:site-specific integrase [Clostridium tetani]|uniref:tyrosine-type recombinase/integrase n=1 Tax=Clostridium tetani TaxID=1513 RepID=UPI001009927F|nr:site-specific integrase [Clostridium tetani]RXI60139.1 site-specific integrase [Clostridium tetani]RXI61022.1 site-specific integrase [Clostridium tetani]RXI64976.1 site-specific integrase [Clostridium tetani]RXI71015.1 site-specific integrase [Clostridium tetani]RXM72216.1 site-specific integrase [Clostridium tetani]
MAKKSRSKANGEGTIYTEKRNGKNYYRGQISLGYDDKGKLIRKSFSGYSKQEVIKKMNEYQYKNNAGLLPSDDKITLQQWFKTWLFEFRINDLKPSSFERYEGIYRKYILNSPIGKMSLSELRAKDIQKYYNSLSNKGISANVVNTINGFLYTCLESALKQNYIPQNYCKLIILPKIIKEDEFTVLTLEEQNIFLNAIQGHKYQAAFTLALGTGLRLGELLGLKWSDIDFNKNTVSISRSIKRTTLINDEGERNSQVLEQLPKTKTSIREVPIPSNIIENLKQYREKQLLVKKENKDVYNDNDYIFSDKLGNPLDPKRIPRNFKSILKKTGLKDIKFHSLRHTYATRLFEADVPIKTVQALMGHSDITTTMNIYTHVMPEQKNKAVEKIDKLFKI